MVYGHVLDSLSNAGELRHRYTVNLPGREGYCMTLSTFIDKAPGGENHEKNRDHSFDAAVLYILL